MPDKLSDQEQYDQWWLEHESGLNHPVDRTDGFRVWLAGRAAAETEAGAQQ